MKKFKQSVIVAIVALFSNFASAQNVDPINKEGIANGGYDLVSYFTANKATKGSSKFTVEQNGAKYYFASATNQKAFKANPKKYLPVCDGYCAWGVAEKQTKFPVNPETYKIINGKLYLFFNGDFNGTAFNTLPEWNKDEKKLLKNIDAAWIKVRKS